jgi:hypothetical protein
VPDAERDGRVKGGSATPIIAALHIVFRTVFADCNNVDQITFGLNPCVATRPALLIARNIGPVVTAAAANHA